MECNEKTSVLQYEVCLGRELLFWFNSVHVCENVFKMKSVFDVIKHLYVLMFNKYKQLRNKTAYVYDVRVIIGCHCDVTCI